MLCKKSRLVEIADLLEMDPSSISKELQRNRVLTKNGTQDKGCKQTLRFPYVCNTCTKNAGGKMNLQMHGKEFFQTSVSTFF